MPFSFDCLEDKIEEAGFTKELPDDSGRLAVLWPDNGLSQGFILNPTSSLLNADLLEVVFARLGEEVAAQIGRVIENLCGGDPQLDR